MKHSIVFALTLSLMAPALAHAEKFKIDEGHTTVGFKIKHLVIATVTGRFNKFDGNFAYDEKDKKVSDLAVKIDASSIDTNEPKRDAHLKSADFLDVAKYPKLSFVGGKTTFEGDKPVSVAGKLTLHGVTKPVTLKLDFKGKTTDPWGNSRVVFEAASQINRKDFGLKWNKTLETGGMLVGEDVTILIEGEAIMEGTKEAKK